MTKLRIASFMYAVASKLGIVDKAVNFINIIMKIRHLLLTKCVDIH